MPGLLRPWERAICARFVLFRRMRAHAGVPDNGDMSKQDHEDLRSALLACASCSEATCCQGWLDQQRDGLPLFCRARPAFERLAKGG